MFKIGILELHFHVKFLHTMMKICKMDETEITIFTTEDLYKNLKPYLQDEEYRAIIKRNTEDTTSYLKRVEKICNDEIDLLFVNTIETSSLTIPPYLKFNPKTKKILTVHVLNHWLKSKFSINRKNIPRSFDTSASIYLIRNIVLPRFNAINVLYPPMKNFVEKKTCYNKKVFTIPYLLRYKKKKDMETDVGERIKVILPGFVEPYRRDYKTALDVFKILFKYHGDKISLNLLGKPVGAGGERIIERCKEMKRNGDNIYFSEGYVPEDVYDKTSAECDIIFSPMNVMTTRPSGINEIYGETECSAIPFEAIQHCKPLIVPEGFNVLDEMKSSTLIYKDSNELNKIFLKMIMDRKRLAELKKEAVKNSENFSLEKGQEYFKENILFKLDEL